VNAQERALQKIGEEICPATTVLCSQGRLFGFQGFLYYFCTEVSFPVRKENNFSGMIFSRKSIEGFWKL